MSYRTKGGTGRSPGGGRATVFIDDRGGIAA